MFTKSIRRFLIPVLFLLLGIILAFFIFRKSSKENTVGETRIINHEVQRLNKMIVIEQNYSAFRTKKYNDFSSKYLNFLNKNIVLYITAKAQVTYDMKQMQIEVDSVNKKIHIVSIPEPELNVFPNVEIYSMEKGFLNDFSKSELNAVMKEGKEDIQKEVEKSNIKSLAQEQLLINLQDLYMIARLYKWEIIDDTPYSQKLKSIQD